MSIENGRDYLYLIWKDNVTRRQYIVGELSKNGGFEFKYGFEVQEAMQNGFKPLLSFEDLGKVYKNPSLFPVFLSRIPDRKRKDIDKILKKYNLEEYDEYKLLKRSGAKLPIDNLKFIDPILNVNDSNIFRIFDVAGPRHYIGCNGKDCEKALNVKVGDEVYFISEPENEHDENAIKIVDCNSNLIGHVPRYYSESVKELLDTGYGYRCTVYEVQKDSNCNECIKVKLFFYKQ